MFLYLPLAVGAFAPSLTAFFLAYREEGREGARQLWRRSLDFHVPLRWLGFVFLVPPAIAVASVFLASLITNEAPNFDRLTRPLHLASTFLFLFFANSVAEEYGWRGHALDRLQARWSPLLSSLFLGLVWAVWHVPLRFVPDLGHSVIPLWAFVVYLTSASVLYTLLYRAANRSILVPLLFHTTTNFSSNVFPVVRHDSSEPQWAFVFMAILYVAAAVVVVGIWGPGLHKPPRAPRRAAGGALTLGRTLGR